MDKIEIRITRDCDSYGNGGTVVENAGALLGDVAGNGPMLDAILAAFADAYGVYSVNENGVDTPVSLYRNLTYRIRTHITEITAAFLRKQAIEQFTAQVDSQVDATLGSVIIIDQSSF